MQRVLQKQKNLKPGWGGILTEGFFAVRGPHSNWGGGIFGIRGGILTFILTVYIYIMCVIYVQKNSPHPVQRDIGLCS